MKYLYLLAASLLAIGCGTTETPAAKNEKHKVLILDGQNNHYIWPKTTVMMKEYLEETGLFEVEVNRTDSVWLGIKYNPNRAEPLDGYIRKFPLDSTAYKTSEDPIQSSTFELDFDKYDLIISNLGADTPDWPSETKRKFEAYMRNGGGFVLVHAANNAWGDWDEFNKMIGLGAWGDRDSLTGPYVYYNDTDSIELDPSEGICATHGIEQTYVVESRAPEHPIMKGLPTEWLHAKDELYDRMRGPFINTTILATAFSDVEKNKQPWEPVAAGTGWNVPTLLAIEYGKGRIFHTTLGHFDYSMECVGFISTLQRGAEWAATGNVTQAIPTDFPSKEQTSTRNWRVADNAASK